MSLGRSVPAARLGGSDISARIPILRWTLPENVLYLAVLPLVHIRNRLVGYLTTGSTPAEQVLTLFPDKNFATEFFPDEVQFYIETFRLHSPTGGHVLGYEFFEEPTDDGRLIVRVVQHVA
jgi:hypothetical protein